MRIKIYRLIVCILCAITANQASAQYKAGMADVSVSITNVQHGLPFKMIAPIHPGIEIGATFLKKEKEKAYHSFSTTAGFYHHSLISNGTYLNLNYNYQRKVKNMIGIDLHPGLGFLYAVYPGEGYRFNESTQAYESTVNGKANAVINLGFGLSYIRHHRLHPFIHYDFNVYNIWAFASYVNSTAVLKAGVKINLD